MARLSYFVNQFPLKRIKSLESMFITTPMRCQFSSSSQLMESQKKHRILITRNIPSRGIDLLKDHCEIIQWKSNEVPVPRDFLLANVKGVDGLLCLLTDKIDKAVLDTAGPNLKIVSTMSVGFDHVDIEACRSRNIPVGYTPGILTDATAELTVALLLAASRRLFEAARTVRTGEWGSWSPMWMCGLGLRGSTVGIVGLGRIGMAVLQRLKPFGVGTFLYTGRTPKSENQEAEFVSFEELLRRADFVVATCALSDETRGLFNQRAFSLMKDGAVFVNTARGGVVDQDALVQALKEGKLRAAGLDVTTPEPLPPDHPLLELSNCVVLPHIASAEDDTRQQMSAIAAENLLRCLEGKPLLHQVGKN